MFAAEPCDLSLPPSASSLSPSLASVYIFWWRCALDERRGVKEGVGRGAMQYKQVFF